MGQYPEALAAFQAAFRGFGSMAPAGKERSSIESPGTLFRPSGRSGCRAAVLRGGEKPVPENSRPALESASNLGDIWNRRGEIEKALALLTQSRALAQQSGNEATEVYSLLGLGKIYLQLGQFSSSLDSLQEAVRLEDKTGLLSEKAATLRTLADLHLRRNETTTARRYLDEALTLERERANRGGEAYVLKSLGVLALKVGQPAEAKVHFEESLTISRKTGNLYGEAFALLNLGRALYEVKDVEGALRVHEEAAPLFSKLSYPWVGFDAVWQRTGLERSRSIHGS